MWGSNFRRPARPRHRRDVSHTVKDERAPIPVAVLLRHAQRVVVEREVMTFRRRERVTTRYVAARLSREIIPQLAARRPRAQNNYDIMRIGHGVDGERRGQQSWQKK